MPPKVTSALPYWPGGDVARDLVILPNKGGGYLLDRSGGIHRFSVEGGSMPPSLVVKPPYFAGLDRARALVMTPDFSRGYLADSRGLLHPFSFIGPAPPETDGPKFSFDIARTAGARQ